ncbi:hypothetical protein NDU88_004387 [Pleurodeles waltl]|uniref:Uncharacterized protein n=1 Tax=Pleurodeles waltl TaxID=8319 RepID=A0AAV7W6H3_PLEWA|nr:hypothetical protein NDU88_004387 [Pleurodeles waltl]
MEGRKVLKHLPQAWVAGDGDELDEYESAMKALDARFKKKSVIMERHKFYKRQQMPDESIESFVGDLRVLASTCDFKMLEDEIIRDQVVEMSNNKKILEKLLTIDDLTLEKAIEFASNIESMTKFMEQMSVKSEVHSVQMQNINKHIDKKAKSSNNNKKKSMECYSCGSKRHLGNSQWCLVLDKVCNKCRKKGHFIKVCKGNWAKDLRNNKSGNAVEEGTSKGLSDTDEDSVVFVVQENQEILCTKRKESVAMVMEKPVKKPLCSIAINGIMYDMMADSGSLFTLISFDEWRKTQKGELKKSKVKPIAYGG